MAGAIVVRRSLTVKLATAILDDTRIFDTLATTASVDTRHGLETIIVGGNLCDNSAKTVVATSTHGWQQSLLTAVRPRGKRQRSLLTPTRGSQPLASVCRSLDEEPARAIVVAPPAQIGSNDCWPRPRR